MIKVLIIDAHPIFREGISALLQDSQEFALCGEAESCATGLAAIQELKPDIVILDFKLPDRSGIHVINESRRQGFTGRFLVLSLYDELVHAGRAITAGATGYLMKVARGKDIMDALTAVYEDRIYVAEVMRNRLYYQLISRNGEKVTSPLEKLSEKEKAVFILTGKLGSPHKVAEALGVAHKTVETYKRRARIKLGLEDFHELLVLSIHLSNNENCPPPLPPGSKPAK